MTDQELRDTLHRFALAFASVCPSPGCISPPLLVEIPESRRGRIVYSSATCPECYDGPGSLIACGPTFMATIEDWNEKVNHIEEAAQEPEDLHRPMTEREWREIRADLAYDDPGQHQLHL